MHYIGFAHRFFEFRGREVEFERCARDCAHATIPAIVGRPCLVSAI